MVAVTRKIQEEKILRIREQIEKVDGYILSFIKKRMRLATKIGKIKRKLEVNILDPRQEEKVKARYLKLAKKLELEEKFVESFCKLILRESKRIQRKQ